MEFVIIAANNAELFRFTVASANALWVAVNEPHLNGMISLFKGHDMLMRMLPTVH